MLCAEVDTWQGPVRVASPSAVRLPLLGLEAVLLLAYFGDVSAWNCNGPEADLLGVFERLGDTRLVLACPVLSWYYA
ncbi:MAG: hypothetical protein L0G85_10440 [Kocuria sp.]|nr:hypothetical protein [Kocuria sp.]